MSGDYETHKNQQPHVSYAGNKVDLDNMLYSWMVSSISKDYQSFLESLSTLTERVPIFTEISYCTVGISAEGGEFMEIVKKMVSGKPWNHDNRSILLLSWSVMWYVMQHVQH